VLNSPFSICRQSFCSTASRIHVHVQSPIAHVSFFLSFAPFTLFSAIRDPYPRSILTPSYSCFLLFCLFLCLFVTISLLLRSDSCCLSPRVLRLLTLATLALASAFIGPYLSLRLFYLANKLTFVLNETYRICLFRGTPLPPMARHENGCIYRYR